MNRSLYHTPRPPQDLRRPKNTPTVGLGLTISQPPDNHQSPPAAPQAAQAVMMRDNLVPHLTRLPHLVLGLALLLAVDPRPLRAADGPLSAADAATYTAAFAAGDAARWPEAYGLAASAKDKRLLDALAWRHMRTTGPGSPSIGDRLAFLERHSTWPLASVIQRITEDEMYSNPYPNQSAVAFFQKFPPQSGLGKAVYARALLATGNRGEATRLAREAWVEADLSSGRETAFLKDMGSLLRAEDHLARADRLVWDQDYEDARRLLPRLSGADRALIEARIILGSGQGNADAAVAKVPAARQGDPGLVFERVRWRRKAGLDVSAIELLLNKGDTVGREDRWWWERAILLRDALDRGEVSAAFALAKSHEHDEGLAFAEGEWYAGWIALRNLNKPQVALGHFEALYNGVSTPISRSRGAYWSGRAAAAAGQADKAKAWYAKAAEFPATFYGQLAIEAMGEPLSKYFPKQDVTPTEADKIAISGDPLVAVASRLAQIRRDQDMLSFLLELERQYDSPGARKLIADIPLKAGLTGEAVFFSRRASLDGTLLVEAGYPLPAGVKERVQALGQQHGLEPALILGIIRQESNFDANARSPAGALGLMQLMPNTAKLVARQENVALNLGHLTADPHLNMRLGSRYLGQLVRDFGGSYVMSIAGYNAGPGRPRQWARDNDRVRHGPLTDAVDWIESIPFRETRNYVQRVLEGTMVYRLRLGQTIPAGTLTKDVTR